MNKTTLKAISRRVRSGLDTFVIGRNTYYVNRKRRTVIYYDWILGANPQIIYFDELPEEVTR